MKQTKALLGLSIAMLMSSLDTSIANVALPTLARAFDAPFPRVQWVVLAYLLAITTLIVGAGRLGDLVGRKRLLLAGIVLFTGASLACGLAPTLGTLVAARAAQGLGAAVLMALTVAFVGEAVPKGKTGSAMGLLGTMSAVGTALGPTVGGLLITAVGWRTIFLVNAPLGVAAFVLVRRYLPADRERAVRRFDLPGTLLLALALGAYALALAGEGFGGREAVLLVVAAFVAGLFVLVERRAAEPLIRPGMFRDAGLSSGLAASALVATVIMATLVVGPFYLSRALGLSPALVGLAMSFGPLAAALSGIPAGRIVDRFGAGRATLVGLAGIGAGCAALALLPRLGVLGYLVPIVVVTSHYALFQTANNTAVVTSVAPERRGVVSGMLSLSRNLGLITGASLLGAVFARGAGTGEIAAASPEAVAAGMRVAYAVAAGMAGVGIGVVVGARRALREEGAPEAVRGASIG